jgi:hypothetical protein
MLCLNHQEWGRRQCANIRWLAVKLFLLIRPSKRYATQVFVAAIHSHHYLCSSTRLQISGRVSSKGRWPWRCKTACYKAQKYSQLSKFLRRPSILMSTEELVVDDVHECSWSGDCIPDLFQTSACWSAVREFEWLSDVWSDFSLVGYCGDEDPCGSQSGMLGPRGRHSPDFGQYFQLARQIKQLTNYSLSRPVFAAVEDHKLIAGGAWRNRRCVQKVVWTLRGLLIAILAVQPDLNAFGSSQAFDCQQA